MISKLPRWVEYGSFILALIAGFINAVGLLGFNHQSISHLSGTATLLGSGILNSDFFTTIHLGLILISFLIGSMISGYFLTGGSLRLGRNYSRLLTLEGIFIFTSFYFLSKDSLIGHYLASIACGLQNALVTTYSGAVIRTTHVTGIFTDLGIMLGSKLRGELFDKRKAILFLLIIAGFIVGGILGSYFFGILQFSALLIPAFICWLLALFYSIYLTKMNDF